MKKAIGATVLFAMLFAAISSASPSEIIWGYVTYESGAAAKNAFVTATIHTEADGDPDPDTYSGYADSDGRYTLHVYYNSSTGGELLKVEAKTTSWKASRTTATANDTSTRVDLALKSGGASGLELTPGMETENFKPLVFMHREGCDVFHNYADSHGRLIERIENYAFEGEQIACNALVIDKNGIEKVKDVFMAVAKDREPTPDDMEVNCNYIGYKSCGGGAAPCTPASEFNARINQEELTEWNSDVMGVYNCILTIESQYSMYGEYWVSVVAEDMDEQIGYAVEQEYWYMNPEIALLVMGDVDFGVVRPGTVSYAETLTVANDADPGSGVLLSMFISGRDFTDPTNSGAKCPTSNVLTLRDPTGGNAHNFGYYARNGAYRTMAGCTDPQGNYRSVHWFGGVDEGYYSIPYETGSENNRQEIIECSGTVSLNGMNYPAGNVLSPGADMSITFAVALPEPCNGDFTDGSFYLWAEAI